VNIPLSRALAEEGWCPRCLGELDTGYECNDCGYDAYGLVLGCEPLEGRE
jgi:hypothetical protein